VAHYFTDVQAKLDELEGAVEEATRAVDEYIEEHAVEEGLLADAMDDDKISKALVSARLKAIRRDGDPDEVKALQQSIKLYDTEADAKKVVKETKMALDLATLNKYAELTPDDVKRLVLDDKWQATIVGRVSAEVEDLTFALVTRIHELGARYAETVHALDARLDYLESKVSDTLSAMGVKA
jgi:type I restriction enzyme M protein